MGLFGGRNKRLKTKAEPKRENQPWCGAVLLRYPQIDWEKVRKDLRVQWDLTFPQLEEEHLGHFTHEDMVITCSMIAAPLPEEQVEAAANHLLWRGGAERVKEHQAYLRIEASKGNDPVEQGIFLVKLVSCLLQQPNAIGFLQYSTVFSPDYYQEVAVCMRQGGLPVPLWIYVELYHENGLMYGYTVGMRRFYKDEMEVVDSTATPAEIYGFLFSMAERVIARDERFEDGQTLLLSDGQSLEIRRSRSRRGDGESLKFPYCSALPQDRNG